MGGRAIYVANPEPRGKHTPEVLFKQEILPDLVASLSTHVALFNNATGGSNWPCLDLLFRLLRKPCNVAERGAEQEAKRGS